MTHLLEVKNLSTHFFTDAGAVKAVSDVSFSIGVGETVGLVGESGCGKSVLSLSLLRLVPRPGKIISGSIQFQLSGSGASVDLLSLDPEHLRTLRGKKIAMIFQEPMTSLNPVMTIGDQIIEAVLAHEPVSKKEAYARSWEMLQKVGLGDSKHRMEDYPHQLSGGMRQRVMIAMALVCRPDLLIADEPTTALDVTIQSQILELLARLQEEFRMALLLITHDLGIVSQVTKRVLVMYAGQVVEEQEVSSLFEDPQHPYTQGLIRSLLPLVEKKRGLMETIPGQVPSLVNLPQGCYFQDRCPHVQEKCRQEEVPLFSISTARSARCFFPGGNR